jgi:hypothetical protein
VVLAWWEGIRKISAKQQPVMVAARATRGDATARGVHERISWRPTPHHTSTPPSLETTRDGSERVAGWRDACRRSSSIYCVLDPHGSQAPPPPGASNRPTVRTPRAAASIASERLASPVDGLDYPARPTGAGRAVGLPWISWTPSSLSSGGAHPGAGSPGGSTQQVCSAVRGEASPAQRRRGAQGTQIFFITILFLFWNSSKRELGRIRLTRRGLGAIW